jgi:hypothetical protein
MRGTWEAALSFVSIQEFFYGTYPTQSFHVTNVQQTNKVNKISNFFYRCSFNPTPSIYKISLRIFINFVSS